MGTAFGVICRQCDHHFMSRLGGGFFFDLLHCEVCGATKSLGHQELGDIHLSYVKGLPGPYAVTRAGMDRQIQAEYPGRPITEDEYHAAAEATLDACQCGGQFRYSAPPRCPNCRSTPDHWDKDPHGGMMFYD